MVASFKHSGSKPVWKDLLMQSANTENDKLHCSKISVGIFSPTEFVFFDNLW